jgi:predicted nucleotidyltransferase
VCVKSVGTGDVSAREIAIENEIMRGVVGSTAHGTAIDGQDDRDEMGVFIESPENVCGLTPCDHYIYRDKPNGVRSEPGDFDLAMYSLRKFCRLAYKGNPSILLLLWLPDYVTQTELAASRARLPDIRDAPHSPALSPRSLFELPIIVLAPDLPVAKRDKPLCR